MSALTANRQPRVCQWSSVSCSYAALSERTLTCQESSAARCGRAANAWSTSSPIRCAGRHVAVAKLVGQHQASLSPAHQQRLIPAKPLVRPQRALLRRLHQMGIHVQRHRWPRLTAAQ